MIVDNNDIGCFMNFNNLIPIPDYTGSEDDDYLKHLAPYLLSFIHIETVTQQIRTDFLML